ncbi:hypothetical protein DR64_1343 [Paraburkholderia xenovorans LB400]|jgi:hypothetical protein|uniref:Uncharacterized protein n=1 Tax=Paraburkholderia xenovorans (strain LB400) TaxID=266265 RepID=Q144A2_PARXL|nr:hypothetical protein [Paraburkholderia xenovorans]ABE29337.1 hypothetical protein Bxe_A3651 [Paraburkholderia xenovorans LB400]AIP29994.1 hypothetical protein DR64_1343 [Paraburkholderia xenovorans LB400]
MATTTIATTASNAAVTREIVTCESFQRLNALLEKKRRLVARIESLPAEITRAHDTVGALQAEATGAEIGLADAEKKPAPIDFERHEAALAALAKREVEAELLERGLRARLNALEEQVTVTDEEISVECRIVGTDAADIANKVLDALATELEVSLAPVRAVYAKIVALTDIVPIRSVQDFRISAHLSDPRRSFMHYFPHCGGSDDAPNLLQVETAQTEAAKAAVHAAMKPVAEALRAMHSHVRYVHLDKRPQPYRVKSEVVTESGPRGRFAGETVVR